MKSWLDEMKSWLFMFVHLDILTTRSRIVRNIDIGCRQFLVPSTPRLSFKFSALGRSRILAFVLL